jgi:precorrin-3B synthase
MAAPTDRCPGVLRVHDAADGGLARIRLPGGLVSAAQLVALATAAAELGDGGLELTSRGNVQVRGLAPGAEAELADRLTDAGLLPSTTHERVRNIVASPLAGLDSYHDLTALIRACDAALCATPALADLSGRFLIAIDDGRGDVARLDADVVVTTAGPDAYVGTLRVSTEDAVPTVIGVCLAFLEERRAQGSTAWRVRELDGMAWALALPPTEPPPPEPVGAVSQVDGGTALALLAPLGRIEPDQAGLLADVAGPRGLRVTPWRSVVVTDVADPAATAAAAAATGLGIGADSPWYRLSACAGRPGCERSLADVRRDAAATPNRWPGRQVRWSGCERRCGRPTDTDVDVVATGSGYRVTVGGAGA